MTPNTPIPHPLRSSVHPHAAGSDGREASLPPLSRPDGTEHRDCVARLSGSVVARKPPIAMVPTAMVIEGSSYRIEPIIRRAAPVNSPSPILSLRLFAQRKSILGKGRPMANQPRHIDLAVEDALQTREEAEKLIRQIDKALEDDTVSPEEALAILHQAKEVLREAHEVVIATERANVAELVTASVLKTGQASPYLLKRARDCGLAVAMPVMPVVHIEDYLQNTPA